MKGALQYPWRATIICMSESIWGLSIEIISRQGNYLIFPPKVQQALYQQIHPLLKQYSCSRRYSASLNWVHVWSTVYAYTRHACSYLDSNTLEPDTLQNDHPNAYVIDRRYSSALSSHCAFIPRGLGHPFHKRYFNFFFFTLLKWHYIFNCISQWVSVLKH